MSETKEVRREEQLPQANVEQFIRTFIPNVPQGELCIKQFSAGHSNLTYLLQIGDWEAVLRRPPLGPIAPKAHDMQRESFFLQEIGSMFTAAPQIYATTVDEHWIGAPFFIMERKKGMVLDTTWPKTLPYEPTLGQSISQAMVDGLVDLHQIPPTNKLLTIAQPQGFMARQVKGWISRYQRAKTADIQGVETIMRYLEQHTPTPQAATIIHYDYKVNNAMFTSDCSKMVGLFDWEMSTIGDPLADVAVAMTYWMQQDDHDAIKYALGKPPVTVLPGFYTRDDFLQRYSAKTGFDLANMNYYIIFAYFKLAVIGQQIYYRYAKGQTTDNRFQHFDQLVANMIQHAYALVP